MFSLLLSTLAMMGLTFVIGFFVAGVIKIIANWADFFDFYNLHHEEINDLKRLQKSQQNMIVSEVLSSVNENGVLHNKPRKMTHGISNTINEMKPRKRVIA